LDRSLPPVPIEQSAEPMVTLEEVSKQLNVSTKTMRRWKKEHYLVGWRVLHNGRRHLGFPKAVVERFVAAHQPQVARGMHFSHLSDGEKVDIVRRAKRLAHAGGSLTEVSRRIAHRLGRSTEAVRYTIKNYDRTHSGQAVFPTVTGPLDAPAKQLIFNSYRRGIPVQALAKKFGRTRNSMYRVINEVRAEQILLSPSITSTTSRSTTRARRPTSSARCPTPRSSRPRTSPCACPRTCRPS